MEHDLIVQSQDEKCPATVDAWDISWYQEKSGSEYGWTSEWVEHRTWTSRETELL